MFFIFAKAKKLRKIFASPLTKPKVHIAPYYGTGGTFKAFLPTCTYSKVHRTRFAAWLYITH